VESFILFKQDVLEVWIVGLASLTVYMEQGSCHSCDPVGCRFCGIFLLCSLILVLCLSEITNMYKNTWCKKVLIKGPYYRYCRYVTRIYVLGRLETRHLVRVYSTNLFWCRNVTLDPLCVVACVAVYWRKVNGRYWDTEALVNSSRFSTASDISIGGNCVRIGPLISCDVTF
jgi:hypothetical protein